MAAAPPQHLSLCSIKLCCTNLRTEETLGSFPLSAQHIYLPFFIIQRLLKVFFFCILMKSLQIVYIPMFSVGLKVQRLS